MQKKYMRIVGAAGLLGLLALGACVYWVLKKSEHRGSASFDMASAVGVKNIIPIAIIGSGCAGLSSAIYGARLGFHTVVFQGKNPGGQLVGTSYVENWPGIAKTMGADIIMGVQKQAQQFGAVISADAITQVDFSVWPYLLTTEEGKEVRALTVIIATGSSARKLDVPGESEYWGRGVTACAICDAPFYKDKNVIVVGGGDSAVEQVMQLAPYARTIQLFVRGEAMRASFAMQEHLKQVKQVTVHFNTKISAINGDDRHVRSIDYIDKNGAHSMPIDGIFLAIGHEPNTAIFKDSVACNKMGYIKPVIGTQKTSVAGVFVAGDVADDRYRQAGVAAGDGIKAALDAANFLHEHGYNEAVSVSLESAYYMPDDVLRYAVRTIESLDELDGLIADSTLPVLVDFYTPQCPSCMQMLPAIEALAAQHQENIVVVKVDGSKLPTVMDRWLVTTVPHILVFKSGALVARTKEVMNKRELINFVKQFFV